ncbi:hypothetical protein ACGGZK_03195 [Agromyces sp. MMS24-K17]|uniref:hypothetical protein n=1 Tax=Agromyces sp. MMS24-K17 TaxID=3372850 RepID=UPI00375532D0
MSADDPQPRARSASGRSRDRVVTAAIAEARRFAALSGPFDPVAALRSVGGIADLRAGEITAVAADLSRACERAVSEDGRWLMRGVERRRTLTKVVADEAAGAVADAIAARRAVATDDPPTLDLLDALDGSGAFTDPAIDDALAAGDPETLTRVGTGLGRAGSLAPAAARLAEVRAALVRLGLGEASGSVGDGPDGASARPSAARAVPGTPADLGTAGPPVSSADLVAVLDAGGAAPGTLAVIGVPADEASVARLEAAAAALLARDDWVVVRLDFSRVGLDVQDTTGLTLELARQLAAQVPGAERAILEARQQTSGTVAGTRSLKGDSPESVPEELSRRLGAALVDPPRRVLVVLRSVDELRARGRTHPARLIDWLRRLAVVGGVPATVLGEGLDGEEAGMPADAHRSARLMLRAPTSGDPVARLRDLNDRSDWIEADLLYREAFEHADLDAAAVAPDALLTFLWRSGRWAAAQDLAERLGGWDRPDIPLLAALAERPLDTLCRLELGAEFAFDGLVRALRSERHELGDAVAEWVSGPSVPLLGPGALRFALYAAGVPVRVRPPELDPGGAAIAAWWPGTDASPASDAARSAGLPPGDVEADVGWSRIADRIARHDGTPLAQPDTAAARARALAALTPYDDVVDTMSRLPEHRALRETAEAAHPRLGSLGFLLPARGARRLRGIPAPTLELRALTDLGLLAELVGATGWLGPAGGRDRDPGSDAAERDLALVAGAAERWRRTVGGRWSYGVPPDGAPEDAAPWVFQPLDESIAHRVDAILGTSRRSRADVVDRAVEELSAWHAELAELDPEAVVALLRDRAGAAARRAEYAVAAAGSAADGAAAAAAALLDGGVPSAFVPGLAVLLSG